MFDLRYPNERLVHYTYGAPGSAGDVLGRLDAIHEDDDGEPGGPIARYAYLGAATVVTESETGYQNCFFRNQCEQIVLTHYREPMTHYREPQTTIVVHVPSSELLGYYQASLRDGLGQGTCVEQRGHRPGNGIFRCNDRPERAEQIQSCPFRASLLLTLGPQGVALGYEVMALRAE